MNTKQLSYHDWLARNRDIADAVGTCPICTGSGTVDDVMGDGTGSKCELCHGTGEVKLAPLYYVQELDRIEKLAK